MILLLKITPLNFYLEIHPALLCFFDYSNPAEVWRAILFKPFRSVVTFKKQKSPAKAPSGTSTRLTSNLADRAIFPLCK